MMLIEEKKNENGITIKETFKSDSETIVKEYYDNTHLVHRFQLSDYNLENDTNKHLKCLWHTKKVNNVRYISITQYYANGVVRRIDEKWDGNQVTHSFYDDGKPKHMRNGMHSISWNEDGEVTFYWDRAEDTSYNLSELTVSKNQKAKKSLSDEKANELSMLFNH